MWQIFATLQKPCKEIGHCSCKLEATGTLAQCTALEGHESIVVVEVAYDFEFVERIFMVAKLQETRFSTRNLEKT